MFSVLKNGLIGFVFLLSMGSCKKAIEKAQEEAVLEAITSGYWTVTSYQKDNTDMTGNFSGYKFQFNENNTVTALKNNVVEKTGSWQTNISSRTITSNFSNAVEPLVLLNGTWTINNSTWTSVEASQTTNGTTYKLRLDKE